MNHLNDNLLDNRDENVVEIDSDQLEWKEKCRNRKMRFDNNSGCNGVHKTQTNGYYYWEVRGKDYDGKIFKKFSVKKFETKELKI